MNLDARHLGEHKISAPELGDWESTNGNAWYYTEACMATKKKHAILRTVASIDLIPLYWRKWGVRTLGCTGQKAQERIPELGRIARSAAFSATLVSNSATAAMNMAWPTRSFT